jgi:hypothetical protein
MTYELQQATPLKQILLHPARISKGSFSNPLYLYQT